MTGIETAIGVSYAAFILVSIYTFGIKQELNEYRRNERAKKEIAANSTLEARLLKSGGSVHKF